MAVRDIVPVPGSSPGGIICIWNPLTRIQVAVIETRRGSHVAPCTVAVRGHPFMAIAGNDNTIRLWELPISAGRFPVVLEARNYVGQADAPGIRVHVKPTSAIHDATVASPELSSKLQTFDQRDVSAVCPVVTGRQVSLASAHHDGRIRIWDPDTGDQKSLLQGHHSGVTAMCPIWLNGDHALATAGNDCQIRIWNPAASIQTNAITLRSSVADSIYPINAGEGTKLLAFDGGSPVWLWDPLTQDDLREIRVDQVRAACPVEIDGRNYLACSGHDGKIRILDLITSEQIAELNGSFTGVTIMTPVNREEVPLLAGAESGGYIRVWDLISETPRAALIGHKGRVNSLCGLSINNHILLASAGTDQAVRVWDLIKATCLAEIPVRAAALTVTWIGKTLAVGTNAGLLVIELNAELLTST